KWPSGWTHRGLGQGYAGAIGPGEHQDLGGGKNPKKGLLIDYLRNFARSAKEGLPIYRVDGGPGFIWATSFDQKGRGTLRLAAVEVSRFSQPPDPAPVVVQTAAPAHQEQLQVAQTHQEELQVAPAHQEELQAAPAHQEELQSELNQTIEKLQAELAVSINKIADLEKAKSDAERTIKEA